MHMYKHTQYKMDVKPENWTGTHEDQVELFVEILAYLLAREIMDENHKCMTRKSFMRIGRRLIKDEQYYEKSIEHFKSECQQASDKFENLWQHSKNRFCSYFYVLSCIIS